MNVQDDGKTGETAIGTREAKQYNFEGRGKKGKKMKGLYVFSRVSHLPPQFSIPLRWTITITPTQPTPCDRSVTARRRTHASHGASHVSSRSSLLPHSFIIIFLWGKKKNLGRFINFILNEKYISSKSS